MPYIKQERRLELDKDNQLEMIGLGCEGEGELNFVLTSICKGYLEKLGMKSYARFNQVVGAIECCKLELYRRRVAPYEDLKIKENGDV
jgi:hypothetical protein